DKAEANRAFKEIYGRYAPRIHAYCLRVLSDRQSAEDIFQETFVKFYQKAKEDHSGGSIAGFLITIARNLCLNYKRDNIQMASIEDFPFLADDYNPDSRETQRLITMAIELLEMEYKEPLVLRLYDGLSYDEIARICEITTENARKRVFRAKQKIKTILEPYFKDSLN
ncbi:MAG: hypothetical protein QG635_1426, partial [Bacteroidota bacterium]|nr:hypothetical protein [Bacteroidota bacterium]